MKNPADELIRQRDLLLYGSSEISTLTRNFPPITQQANASKSNWRLPL